MHPNSSTTVGQQIFTSEPKHWVSALAPLVVYAAVIFYLSSRSTLPRIPLFFWGSDKLLHFAEFAGFGVLAARAVVLTTGIPAKWVAAISIALGAFYGAADEIHQAYIPGRDPSVFDLVADVLGCTTGAVGFLAVFSYFQRRPKEQKRA